MDQEKLNKIKEIMGEMTCSKGFKCAASGFQKVCKASDHGVEDVLIYALKKTTCPVSSSFHTAKTTTADVHFGFIWPKN